MDDNPAVGVARDEVLRKIGRNVVVFQWLESRLKALIAAHEVNAPIDQWQDAIDSQREKASRLTLGLLVDKVFKRLVVAESGEGEEPDGNPDHWSVAFRLRVDDGDHIEFKGAFDQIVRERNSLIHEELASFNPNCLDSCRDLATRLDRQRENLDPVIRFVMAIEESFREMGTELLGLVESGELFEGAPKPL